MSFPDRTIRRHRRSHG